MNTYSNTTRPKAKPAKPRPDFPLYPHAVGKWAKTIRGRTYYFGTWNDPEGALREYLDQCDDLHAGRPPRDKSGVLTLKALGNAFLDHCQERVDSGEMTERTLRDYHDVFGKVIDVLGKTAAVTALGPTDFAKVRADFARRLGAVALSNAIGRVKVVFNFAKRNLLIDREVAYGSAFDRPSRKTLRKAKATNGARSFTAAECRQLLDNAGPDLSAMILLALNCGFGNSDCGRLPIEAVDLDRGWISFPRPKTGIERRCPLWPETVQAIRQAIAARPSPKVPEAGALVFVTKYGSPWHKETRDNPVSKAFAKLLAKLGMKKPGRNFYSLRHTFRTVADASRDFPACRLIMGHVDESMDGVYREGIGDDRLVAVVNHVRKWLFDSVLSSVPASV